MWGEGAKDVIQGTPSGESRNLVLSSFSVACLLLATIYAGPEGADR